MIDVSLWNRVRLGYALLCLSVISMLAFAYIAEYGFGIRPCKMCYYQRYGMFSSLFLTLLAFVFIKRLFSYFAAIGWTGCSAFSIYQLGVENRWWKTALGCAASSLEKGADLTKALTDMTYVPCDQPSWWIFGLSATLWTAVSMICIGVFSWWMVYQTPKNAY